MLSKRGEGKNIDRCDRGLGGDATSRGKWCA